MVNDLFQLFALQSHVALAAGFALAVALHMMTEIEDGE